MDEGIRAGLSGMAPARRAKVLRDFGLGLAFFLALFASLAWRKHSPKAPWELLAAVVSAAAALTAPRVFAPLYNVWMPAALFLGRVNTYVALVLLYYLVIAPYALVMRLFGARLLDEKLGDAESYWRPKAPGPGLKAYERQF